jgi:hypothetical protein
MQAQSFHRRSFLRFCSLSGAAALAPGSLLAAAAAATDSVFNVRAFGATGQGAKLDTPALQAAIDRCAEAGGGTVYFPAGSYLSGTLFLKSRVTLHLENGAVLLGSKNLADYPPTIPAIRSYTDTYTERSLIYGENLENIALHGRGKIDGQGAAFKGPYKVRPYLLRLVSCRNVSVRDLTLRDSPMWVQHYLACDGVNLDGLTVRSRCNGNNDGIDIDGCQRVRIANCDISSGDDAIVLKSTLDRVCKNVVITNCLLSSDCNAFKLGTESNGGFEDIVVSNCSIYDTSLAGLALELVDGGVLDGVSISNVTMRDTRGAIFIRLGDRARPFKDGMAKPGLGRLRNVHISHVRATGADKTGCSITGLPERAAEEISLQDVHIGLAGGGSEEDARRSPPEQRERYPEYNLFGVLPAFGFYCRHVRGLRLSDVSVSAGQPDHRPAVVCEDVEDLELFRCNSATAPAASPVIRFNSVRDAFVHGCRSPREAKVFLRVEAPASREIRLADNDLHGVRKSVELEAGVPKKAVSTGKAN